jgi:hypothetical protein
MSDPWSTRMSNANEPRERSGAWGPRERACRGDRRGEAPRIRDDVRRLLDRNVCRCGTYPRIVHAVRLAAERMRMTSTGAGDRK